MPPREGGSQEGGKVFHVLGNSLTGGTKGKLWNLNVACNSGDSKGKMQEKAAEYHFSAHKQLTSLSPDQRVGVGS